MQHTTGLSPMPTSLCHLRNKERKKRSVEPEPARLRRRSCLRLGPVSSSEEDTESTRPVRFIRFLGPHSSAPNCTGIRNAVQATTIPVSGAWHAAGRSQSHGYQYIRCRNRKQIIFAREKENEKRGPLLTSIFHPARHMSTSCTCPNKSTLARKPCLGFGKRGHQSICIRTPSENMPTDTQ